MNVSIHRKRWQAIAGRTVTGAAAGIGCLMLTAAPTAAQPGSIPGSGAIEAPNGLVNPREMPGRTEVPGFEFAPLTVIPGDEPQSLVDAAELESPTPPGGHDVSEPRVIPGVGHPFLPDLPTTLQSLLAGVPGVEFPFPADFPGSTPPASLRAAAPQTTSGLAVDGARSELGSQYAGGGAGPDAFGGAGLMRWSYGPAGGEAPRTS
ncbi:hypothetical protein [Nocardia sp. NPDC057440]|uniref:hypothetical protein n=1 Tax=Nocardia sp. NPDC057440 TaxID=3346134 RepID=UPI00366F2C21